MYITNTPQLMSSYPELAITPTEQDYITYLTDLLSRKEFAMLKLYLREDDHTHAILKSSHLQARSYQKFVANFMNPDTLNMRLHLFHMAGVGKTLAACLVGHKFTQAYKKLYTIATAKIPMIRRNYSELDKSTPNIYVLGFTGTRGAFRRELLKYTEFGFITADELAKKNQLQRAASSGMPFDIQALKDYVGLLKRRIQNKAKGGFYKFMGYDELALSLFKSNKYKLTDLEKEAQQSQLSGSPRTLEDIIAEKIRSNDVMVNTQLLRSFNHSLIIGDEIHQTYNMQMKNSRGVALQYVLDTATDVRLLSLSATPINSSPTEIVEVLNYQLPKANKVQKSDLFTGNTLLPGALNKIAELSRGHFSFLQDIDPEYYPTRTFVGEPLKVDASEIPYMRFTICEMSEYHQNTLTQYLRSSSELTADEIIHSDSLRDVPLENEQLNATQTEQLNADRAIADEQTAKPTTDEPQKKQTIAVVTDEQLEDQVFKSTIPTDGYAMMDLVYPNPNNDDVGVFRSGNLTSIINSASQQFRENNGVQVKKLLGGIHLVTGSYLHKERVRKYSSKYYQLLVTLDNIIKSFNEDRTRCQKVFIYHDRVVGSGALLVGELLRENNYIDEITNPLPTTICMVCGKPKSLHADLSELLSTIADSATSDIEDTRVISHRYIPARFTIVHSYMDRNKMEQALDTYNDRSKRKGHSCMILIGTKIVSESYDFKDVQNMILLSMPINFATLIQIYGRCIRNGSHLNLPRDQWRVYIHTLITTINSAYAHVDVISPEVHRYLNKIELYLTIQQIEREISRNAIDASINRDIIMSPSMLQRYFPRDKANDSTQPESTIGMLYYDPIISLPRYDLSQLNVSTFITTKAYQSEIADIVFIIKYLFMQNAVWTYDDLFATVRDPPMKLQVNTSLFSEHNFVIALDHLVACCNDNASYVPKVNSIFTEWLTDTEFKYIYKQNQYYKITQYDKYYIAFPVGDSIGGNISLRSFMDVETYIRPYRSSSKIVLDIASYVNTAKHQTNYQTRKDEFAAKYTLYLDLSEDDRMANMMNMILEYNSTFQKAIIEEAIQDKQRGSSTDANKRTVELRDAILTMYRRFGVIIDKREVAKYADVVK